MKNLTYKIRNNKSDFSESSGKEKNRNEMHFLSVVIFSWLISLLKLKIERPKR